MTPPSPTARSHSRVLAAAALAGMLALASAACSSGDATSKDPGTAAPTTTATPTAAATADVSRQSTETGNPPGQAGPKIAWSTAADTAEKSVPGGKVTEVELDDGQWEADVVTPEPRVHHVEVDATTGAVRDNHADRMPDQRRDYLKIPLAKLAAAEVTRTDAAATALKEAGAGYVSGVSIQGTEARPSWEVDVTDGSTRHEIGIDAKTGATVRQEKDQDDNRD
ncbi:PepSY domain-containing protein [Streptomyces sp. NBC_01304]|uniref:PepSY domain-containing protein n=1 Tax=Streptomyces sp. NBC_01304 TaxID=2903818 RepID=UPI002E105AC0|nr:PepSY domain-containing protein [Streptomyces sp. NBC_01304]